METLSGKMKKQAVISISIILGYIFILAIPTSRNVFTQINSDHAYLMGFVNFAVLSTLGEAIALRIKHRKWATLAGFKYKILLWGSIGVVVTFAFQLFAGGVACLFEAGTIDIKANKYILAFMTSASMNVLFSPTFMLFHEVSAACIEHRVIGGTITLKAVSQKIHWETFLSFVILRTIPFFWIPAHTLVFLLPEEYRIIGAAILSFVLGLILSIRKRAPSI